MANEFSFVETDAAKIYNIVMNWLMDSVNEPLYPADERRIYGEALIYVLTNLYNEMNDAARQKTLQYARGYVLDALGERTGTTRLEPTAAHDIFRFSVEAPVNINVVIPLGTRMTPDGSVYFATQQTAVLQAGSSHIDISAVCTTAGADYNGLGAGTITTLVDLIPYIARVTNLNGTSGGDNGEPYPWEDDGAGDSRFRERIRLAPARFSVAGPIAAYKYFTLSSDSEIIDVFIESPLATEIVIYPLMKGGEIPNKETLQKVLTAFDDDIRPMTDHVTVKEPEQVEYDINIKYYCTIENEADAITIVEGDGGAIDKFIEWQCAELGRDINPDYLKRFALVPDNGSDAVARLDITLPALTELSKKQVAKFSGKVTVSHEVIGG